MILIIALLSLIVIFDAIGDGMRTQEKQIAHHVFEALIVLMWIGLAVYINFNSLISHDLLWIFIYFVCLRIAVFDQVYNIAAGEDLFYVGSSSYWDRVIMRSGWGGILKVMAMFTIFAALVRLFGW